MIIMVALTLMHSVRPKLHRVLAFLSAIGLNNLKIEQFGFTMQLCNHKMQVEWQMV